MSQQIVSSWRQQQRCNPRISLPVLIPKMSRNSVALFLATVALAGGTVACSKSSEDGEQGGDKERPAMTQPSSPSSSSQQGSEDGEGNEDGKGDEDGKGGEDGKSRRDGKGGEDGEGGERGEGGEG
jgi:hypothetical protein